MGNCANCGTALDPAWKFCIHCGAPVRRTFVEPIPAAIRPVDEAGTAKPTKDRSTLIGIIVAIAGVALIIVVATLVFSTHG
ncbi:zinc ribbon domain-containing protein [Glaciihabitans sp. UYNi722]|uniref:zinc ribbon domain-containing protein n=1 Tax=Glaciihabitans sp. UYNi722 TaxID=3156344 RepID=UPI0033923AEA